MSVCFVWHTVSCCWQNSFTLKRKASPNVCEDGMRINIALMAYVKYWFVSLTMFTQTRIIVFSRVQRFTTANLASLACYRTMDVLISWFYFLVQICYVDCMDINTMCSLHSFHYSFTDIQSNNKWAHLVTLLNISSCSTLSPSSAIWYIFLYLPLLLARQSHREAGTKLQWIDSL